MLNKPTVTGLGLDMVIGWGAGALIWEDFWSVWQLSWIS